MKKKRTNKREKELCYYAKSEYQGQCQREPAGQLGTAILVLLLNWMLLSAATGVMVIGKLIMR